MLRLFARWLTSPAARAIAEWEYARVFVLLPTRRWLLIARWLLLIGLVLTTVIARLLPGVLRLDTTGIVIADTLADISYFLLGILGLLAFLSLVSTMLQTSAAAIAREREFGGWELLILTGVRARELALGKWAGVIAALWDRRRELLLWRAVAIALLSIINPFVTTPTGSGVPSFPPDVPLFVRLLSSIPVGLVSAVVITMIAVGVLALASGFGLVAGALVKRRTAANTLAVGIYTGFAVLLLFGGGLALIAMFGSGTGDFLPVTLLLVAPLEGGSLLIQNVLFQPELALAYLLSAAIGAAINGALTWALLRFTIAVLKGNGWAR